MRKYLSLAILLGAFAFSGIAVQEVHSWGAASGDASDFRQLQETAIFFNNSGQTLTQGMVVVLDTGGGGVTTGTTLGAYVTLTSQTSAAPNGAADSTLTIGVVKSVSVVDQRPVVIVTKGPIDTLCADAGDAVTLGASVGTSDVIAAQTGDGLCGAGTNLGVALEGGDGTDTGNIFVWVQGIGSE